MEYLDFFGLRQEPFSNTPVSRFYFESHGHNLALVKLRHAVHNMKGLALLLGNIGAGKTTMARRLLASLDEREYEAALLVIVHSTVTADWLLRRLASQLGVPSPSHDRVSLISQLYLRLIEIYESGRKAVVLIDEAQMLVDRSIMEEFRGLLNMEVPEQKLLSFVFFGLPELEQNILVDPPLAQRIAVKVRLGAFDVATSAQYIAHRLRVAGCQRSPFAPDTFDLIHRASGGLPRLINTVCDNAMLEAALAGDRNITARVIREVAANLGLPTIPPPVRGAAQGYPAVFSEIPREDMSVEELDQLLATLEKLTP